MWYIIRDEAICCGMNEKLHYIKKLLSMKLYAIISLIIKSLLIAFTSTEPYGCNSDNEPIY